MSKSAFRTELEHLINRESMENGSDTPDFILRDFLVNCLKAFDDATEQREHWYGRKLRREYPAHEIVDTPPTASPEPSPDGLA